MVSTAQQHVVSNVVGVIGNIISLFLFLSPVPTFIGIWKEGSVGQYSPGPYLATFMNCMVWVLYGLPMITPNKTLVITINGAGTAIEVVYILMFIIYSDKKKRLKVIIGAVIEVVFVLLLAILVLTLLHTTHRRSLVVGVICCLFNVLMYASPLVVMKMVIKTKSVEYMPFFLSLASLANGLVWTTYAFFPFDPFIAAPNGIGLLFSLAQLVLYATYYKSTQKLIADRKNGGGGEIHLSKVVSVPTKRP